MHFRTSAVSVLIFFCSVNPVLGLELSPFLMRNFSPVALVRNPAMAESARLRADGQLSARLGFDLANNATLSSQDEEAVLFDGETFVATLGLRYGIAERFQIGVDLPYVSHSPGNLDGFIESWHDLFGLPNGDRDDLPKNQLNYLYSVSGSDVLRLDSSTTSLGDMRLSLAWQWKNDSKWSSSLFAQIKSPTGDPDDLSGSGGWDAAVSISSQHDIRLTHGGMSFWWGLGIGRLDKGDFLEEFAKEWVTSGWIGTGWSPLSRLGLKLQVDAHSPLYDSVLDEIGSSALILTLGGTLALSDKTELDIGVAEDLMVNASPDVIFHLLLKHHFGSSKTSIRSD